MKMIAIVLVFVAAGCVTGQQMSQLTPGMTSDEVVEKLGKYDGYKQTGEYEILNWNHKLTSGWSWDRADYHVVLKDGLVVEWGQGVVRERTVQGVHTVVLLQP